MVPYLILLFLIIFLGILLCEKWKSRRNDAIFLCAISILMTALAGIRAESVGVDYVMYRDYFFSVRDGGLGYLFSSVNPYRLEIAYGLFNYLVSLFTGDVHVFMTVAAMALSVMVSVALYRYSSIPWLGMFVFVSFGFYGNSLCFLRQSFGILVFLFAVPCIQEKKLPRYLLLLLVAVLFHKSLLFMLPLYWIARIPMNWKSLTVYAVGTGLVLAFTWPLFRLFTETIPIFPYYATSEGLYYMGGRNWNTGIIPIFVGITAVILNRLMIRRNEKNIVLSNLMVYSALLYIMTYQHFLFQRIGMIVFTTAMLAVPEFAACALPDKDQREALKEAAIGFASKPKGERKKDQLRKKSLERQILMRQYYYMDAVGTVLVFGFLYLIWQLGVNRIDLVPFQSFFW